MQPPQNSGLSLENQRKGNCVLNPRGKSAMAWAIRFEKVATDKEAKQQICQLCKPRDIHHSSSDQNKAPAYGFGGYPAHLSSRVTAQDDSCILYISSVECELKPNPQRFSC